MKNKYENRGDVTAIFLNHNGLKIETLIDTIDLELVSSFKGTWYALFKKEINNFYVVINTYGNKKQSKIRLHRLILNPRSDNVVDHINHNTLNNTRKNLREITNAENQQNQKGASVNCKSGVRGVIWEKRDKLWRSTVKLNGKVEYVKRFKNIEDAEKAVIEARTRILKYSTN